MKKASKPLLQFISNLGWVRPAQVNSMYVHYIVKQSCVEDTCHEEIKRAKGLNYNNKNILPYYSATYVNYP